MKPLLTIVTVAGIAIMPFTFVRAAETPAPARKKVLFYSQSGTAQHLAIRLSAKGDGAGFAFSVLREIGKQNNIEFTYSKDGSLFNPTYLAQFDAYCFYTTGDLTQPAKDGNPSMTPEGKAALLQAVAEGKGFIGIHTATDTFHSPGGNGGGKDLNQPETERDAYIRMVGGEFIIHGVQQPARQIVVDPKFPGIAAVPADFGPTEEWYAIKNFAPDLHAILLQDTSATTGAMYQRANYPSTWARMQDQGRVFYTSMGHREDVWTNAVFQSVLSGGLNWVLKRVDADVTPNLASVAPKAGTLLDEITRDKPKAKSPRPTPAAGAGQK
jgi:type 1 glutamine amidotransferase